MKKMTCQICSKEVGLTKEEYQIYIENNVSDTDRSQGFECPECQNWHPEEEENILDQMGIEPFDEGSDEEDFSPPVKRPTSIRLGDATRRQIDQLIDAGHGNQSEVIALAVYGMWTREQV